jgi:hypothetical protein
LAVRNSVEYPPDAEQFGAAPAFPAQMATGPCHPDGRLAQAYLGEQSVSAQSTAPSRSSSLPFWQFSTRVVHVPATHACVAEQGLLQPLQWALSVLGFTQVLPQAMKGGVQASWQVPPEQTWALVRQLVVQLPQCVSSVVVSTQRVPHRLWVPQSMTQVLPSQTLPGAHGVLQRLQWFSSVVVSTQILVVLPVGVHSARPPAQPGAQSPLEHTSPGAHVVVQSPQ